MVERPTFSIKVFLRAVRFHLNRPRESFRNVPACGLVRVGSFTFENWVGIALLVVVVRPSLVSVDPKKCLPIRKYILSRQKF